MLMSLTLLVFFVFPCFFLLRLFGDILIFLFKKTTFFPPLLFIFSLYCSFTLLLLWCSSRRRNHSPVRCESHSKKRCIHVCALLLQTGHCVFFLLFVHTRFKRRFSSTHLVDFRFVPLTRRKKHACAETTTLDTV